MTPTRVAMVLFVTLLPFAFPAAAEARPCPTAAEINLDYRAFIHPDTLRQPIRVTPDALVFDCDTISFLQAVVAYVTRNARTELERAAGWVMYLQQARYHSCHPPVDTEDQGVYHPIWLLTHRAAQCGQAARLVVDGFNAVGIPARVLQLRSHVAAEVYLLGAWRFVDVDVWAPGVFVLTHSGAPATVDDIIQDRSLVAQVPVGLQLPECIDLAWDYAAVFDSITYDGYPPTPFVWQKTADAAALDNQYYGWNYFRSCTRTDPTCR